ncbi:MAG: hypothetical protein R3F34_00970 [Planctomycetota bacterium]
MRSGADNFGGRPSVKQLAPLLPAALLPLLLVGFSMRPAVEYGGLGSDLRVARERAERATDLRNYLATFGESGLPTAEYRRGLGLLASRLPLGFEATDFTTAASDRRADSTSSLGSIAPGPGARPVARSVTSRCTKPS